MKKEVTNTFLRFLINIPIAVIEVLLSILVFFADADSSYGIKEEEVFSNFSPFKLKKCYSISNPDNKTIELKIVNFQFNKLIKKYSEPDIIVNDDSVFCTDSEVTYCDKMLKTQWKLYTVPAFCVMWAAITLINILCIYTFVHTIREIPNCTVSENIFCILGSTFCLTVTLALFVTITLKFIRLHKMYKTISKNHQ